MGREEEMPFLFSHHTTSEQFISIQTEDFPPPFHLQRAAHRATLWNKTRLSESPQHTTHCSPSRACATFRMKPAASGSSIQKSWVSKAACGGFSKQLPLVPIGAWLLSLHTSLKMFPLSLIDICTDLLRSWDQAGKSFSWGKNVLAVTKLALFQNWEHLATSCV